MSLIQPFANNHLIDRDLSWLDFNYRVLQEAKDPSVPLLERLRFLAIYSSNLGEFFRIRVAHHRNIMKLGKKTKSVLDYNPALMLKELYKITNEQLDEFNQIFYDQIIPGLAKENIYLRSHRELNDQQEQFIENYFNENLLPFVQPVLLIKNKVKPFLNNSELYLAVIMRSKEDPSFEPQYAIVKVPSDHLNRFVVLPSQTGAHEVTLLDEVVRFSLKWLFPGFDIQHSYSIKLTRDAELYIEDEYSGDLLEKIKKGLIKRNIGPAARLVYDDAMPKEMLHYFLGLLDIKKTDLTPEGRYHNNFDFFHFPNFKKLHLLNPPIKPLGYPPIDHASDIFSAISKRDHLLYFPYHDYEPVIRFFEEAARDPFITHIKITQYRVDKNSRIMDALMYAAENGKNVFVFIEVKARFDEAANLVWGEKMQKAGIKVRYSFPGLKVHSKTAIITRKKDQETQHFLYLSTGNFHEGTARMYCDYGFFTTDNRLTSEVNRLFGFLENVKLPSTSFKHLLVGQFNLNDDIRSLILFEKNEALAGRKSEIILKMNNLQDSEIIQLLYEASQAGTKIKLIIRSICCLIPGKRNISDNIQGISIIDRFLEHARVYYFHHGGERKVYLSSADFMVRNLHFRIETAFPIYENELKNEILKVLSIQFSDNSKARSLNHRKINQYIQDSKGRKVRSQLNTYKLYKQLFQLQNNQNYEE
ncbi:MAG: polyphosphate kinase 1 [Saprospiraceae bacterium]|nr:polyphosphate kinase 1 [Saprospiraceae bacterium]